MDPTSDFSSETPRVLLFGHGGSGKSSLLGALVMAGETQADALGGEVRDPDERLELLREHVYGELGLEDSRTELVTYTVRVWPPGDAGEPHTFVLDDCDGDAATALLKHPDPLAEQHVRGPVARAVVEADAIVLLVEAAATDDQLLEAFEQFDTFLTVVSRVKTDARDVGGFPIYLVLTQCDRLAREGDTTTAWEGRVKKRAERARAKFADYLEDDDPTDGVRSPFLQFGSIELDVAAVAVRRPSLTDDPDPPEVPFGVAELFRDVFATAAAHNARYHTSERRLKWTVRAALLAVGFLLLGVVGVLIFQPKDSGPRLAELVTAYQMREPAAAARLAEKQLPLTKKTLKGFQTDPRFAGLPDDLRDFVDRRVREVEAYQDYKAKLNATPDPASARGLDELARIERLLTTDLALPAEHDAWGDTEAAHLRDKWLADIAPIRDAEGQFYDRFRGLVWRANGLILAGSFGGNWRADVATLFADADKPMFPLTAVLPGSEAVAYPRGQAVTYAVPFEYDRVYQARHDWDAARNRLTHLRDLADALGLTAGPNRPEAVLELPEPGPTVDSAALAAARLDALQKAFPGALDSGEWALRNYPQPGRTELANRVQRSFAAGVRHAHKLILVKLGTPPEARDNPDGWRTVAGTLGEPAFRDWGRLLQFLARLQDPTATDPVAELAPFLKQPSFALDPTGFDLTIPLDLRAQRVVPAGPLVVKIASRTLPEQTKSFRVSGDGSRQGQATVYKLVPDGGAKLTYRPGDDLTIELPVRVGTQDAKLVWSAGGTDTFQFDRFGREPRMVRAGATPEPAAGVKLAPAADAGLPKIPVLLPDVRGR